MQDRSLIEILNPGIHLRMDPFRRLMVDIQDITAGDFQHRLAEVFETTQPELVNEHLLVVRLGDEEAGLVFRHDVLTDVIEPRVVRFFWKTDVSLRIERIRSLQRGCVADIGNEPSVQSACQQFRPESSASACTYSSSTQRPSWSAVHRRSAG